jgi:hypothetical protein
MSDFLQTFNKGRRLECAATTPTLLLCVKSKQVFAGGTGRTLYSITVFFFFFLLFPSSGILENTTFRKLDLFPSSGEGGGEDTYSVGPLERANPNHSF